METSRTAAGGEAEHGPWMGHLTVRFDMVWPKPARPAETWTPNPAPGIATEPSLSSQVARLSEQVATLQAALVPFARLGRAMFDSGNCGPDSPADWPETRLLHVHDREHRSPQTFGGCLTVADFRRAERCPGVADLVTDAVLRGR